MAEEKSPVPPSQVSDRKRKAKKPAGDKSELKAAVATLFQHRPRQRYRKANERPRPDLPADAPVNRKKPQVAVTLPPDLIEELTDRARQAGVGRNALIETAIRRLLDRS
jgi:hypothetical protein